MVSPFFESICKIVVLKHFSARALQFMFWNRGTTTGYKELDRIEDGNHNNSEQSTTVSDAFILPSWMVLSAFHIVIFAFYALTIWHLVTKAPSDKSCVYKLSTYCILSHNFLRIYEILIRKQLLHWT